MILLRHGQSEFNLHFGATRRDPGVVDAPLTALGHTQAEEAAQRLLGEGIRRIIVSPYTRALQTAAPIAATLAVPVFVSAAGFWIRRFWGGWTIWGSPTSPTRLRRAPRPPIATA